MTPHPRATTIDDFSVMIVMLSLTHILLLQLTAIDAYSIVPSVTRKRHNIIANQYTNERRTQHWQSVPTSLLASQNFDYVRNATAPTSLVDEDEMRLLRFMEVALLELESFRDAEEEKIAERESHFALPSEDIIQNQEVSLLFPPIEDTSAILKESSQALTSSDVVVATPEEKLVDEEGIWRARWLLVAAAALYGTNFSVVKLLGDEMPVGISTSLRFGLAALATLPWLIQGFVPSFGNSEKVEQIVQDRRIMATLYGLEVGLWNSIGYVAQAVGLETTLASESAFLCSMAVVIVPLLDWIAGKKLQSRQWVGALMALVGVAFLELGDVGALMEGKGSGINTGELLSLVQPFTFGLGFWRMEQAMRRFPQEAPRMTAAQLMAIFISSVAYGLWTMGVFEPFFVSSSIETALAGFQSSLVGIPDSFPWREWSTNPSILFSLFWTGCITTALTIYMETLALESLSAAETTLIFSTEPLWGTAFAVALMGEQMGMNSVAGGGLILMACVYSNMGVSGLQELWASTVNSVGQQNDNKKPSLLNLGLLSGFGAAAAVASEIELQEFDETVEELIENMVDKL
eukprot:CAMPEP_0197268776 /NCGR_PEP_ID=MMETSP1432-20130617/4372_1 /TAXON_ID=44447 /ORGANISM="Pseudo-nitzschia delicatissima, Strain UNC1205" /LENGTH=575 /DNA_ID=CAMNT_0042733857 /DNA_START=115 /DNA_END=1842 /DNA_ORIENTATION=-